LNRAQKVHAAAAAAHKLLKMLNVADGVL